MRARGIRMRSASVELGAALGLLAARPNRGDWSSLTAILSLGEIAAYKTAAECCLNNYPDYDPSPSQSKMNERRLPSSFISNLGAKWWWPRENRSWWFASLSNRFTGPKRHWPTQRDDCRVILLERSTKYT